MNGLSWAGSKVNVQGIAHTIFIQCTLFEWVFYSQVLACFLSLPVRVCCPKCTTGTISALCIKPGSFC